MALDVGKHSIKLRAYNQTCFDEAKKDITIQQSPQGTLNIQPKAICTSPENLSLRFSQSGYDSYKWYVNGKPVGSGYSLSHTYTQQSDAIVTVEVNDNGCTTTLTDTITYSNPVIDITPDTLGCAPITVEFAVNRRSQICCQIVQMGSWK